MKKYCLITYGCQMNKSDSERISTVLEGLNYRPTLDIKEADLVMINACSVRQSAIDRIWGKTKQFAKLKTNNSELKTILTGCVLKEDKRKFSQRFDMVLDIKDLPKLPKILASSNDITLLSQSYVVTDYLHIEPKYQTSFRAYVPIMTGCNNFCVYCAVPYTRGREVSRPAEEVICEIENLIKRGYKEIWLLGENVNSYKSKIKNQKSKIIDFSRLLKMVNNIPGKFWIRFTSPHPKDFSDKLIKTMAGCEKMTEYINLPVQAGDDEILKKMKRPYTVKKYKGLVNKIRKNIPGIALSTDVIVGFPGETKKQFEGTVKLFKELNYDMAYISKYSPRPGTAAATSMKDNVPLREKGKRYKILTEILKKTALENNKKCVGKIVEVLAEERKNGFLIGKTRTYKTIKFAANQNLIGQFVKVKIVDAMNFGLRGELI